MYVEKLDYKFDMNCNVSEEVVDKVVVGVDNWVLLLEFNFKLEVVNICILNVFIYFL